MSGRLFWTLRALVATAGLIPWLFAAARARPAAAIALFHGLCHQLPERTACLGGVAMLVCSRCAGIYAGVALGALIPVPQRCVPRARKLLCVAAVPLLADVILQAAGAMPILHATRLTTGALAGWLASALLFAALRVERVSASDVPTGKERGVNPGVPSPISRDGGA
ncbi:MAG TPA: DUF2085 domain-containing protein [Opitutaceae bacterium]|nr:DUF2085 domain-containing protein [Opitutaceae bacterium]